MNKTREAEIATKKEERAAYFARKKKLLEFEKDNLKKIIFLRGTKGFWVTGGHSAVILANKIAPELNMRVKLRSDTDYDLKFKEGVFVFKNAEVIRAKLNGSLYIDFEKETPNYFSYVLRKEISETEYSLLSQSDQIRRERLRGDIEKSKPFPKAAAKLRDAMRLSYSVYAKNTDPSARFAALDNFLSAVMRADFDLRMIAREDIEITAGVKKIQTQIEIALCVILQILDLELVNPEKCAVLSTLLIQASTSLSEDLMKMKVRANAESYHAKQIKRILEKNG